LIFFRLRWLAFPQNRICVDKMIAFVQTLSRDEINTFERLLEQDIIFNARNVMLNHAKSAQECFIVIEGWVCRYCEIINGMR
jgi:hypothetical protein